MESTSIHEQKCCPTLHKLEKAVKHIFHASNALVAGVENQELDWVNVIFTINLKSKQWFCTNDPLLRAELCLLKLAAKSTCSNLCLNSLTMRRQKLPLSHTKVHPMD